MAPTEAQVEATRSLIVRAMTEGSTAEGKALLNALVHKVTVKSRADVVPGFRFPRR